MAYKVGDRIQCDMSFESKQVADAPDGFIAGIASTAATDLYGHQVLAGAFDKSIKSKGLKGPRGVKLLAYHDWQKVAGSITRLETVDKKLEIEAQLNLTVSYVKDLYEVTRQNGGMNFSVGFRLKEFEFVDEEEEAQQKDDGVAPWLIIKEGDLMEVSVVPFPAQLEAELTFVKEGPHGSLAEFEKALVAMGLCKSRQEAKKLTLAVKQSSHLFLDKPASGAPEPVIDEPHPWLDASKLMAATDLAVKVKAMLGSR